MNQVEYIFFDIGGTLGERDTGTKKLVLFPSTMAFLEGLSDTVMVRMGIITTLGNLSNREGQALLQDAGVWPFFDPNGFVSEHDVGSVAKPHPLIFQFAAQHVRVPISHCLFVGENLLEVVGAQAAGMRGLLKPVPPGRELGERNGGGRIRL
jgi:FMN phosphatase YigB (HAD superfamily)